MAEKYSGTVKWFNHARGYGFILLEDGLEVFVHHNDIKMSGYRYLRRGQRVRFTLVDGPNGPKGTDVSLIEGAPVPERVALRMPEADPRGKNNRTYRRNERLIFEEDREHEFKSLEHARDAVKTISDYYIEKYVNAFLNTRGGVIYFGVDDDGVVQGIALDRARRDQLRTEISKVINQFQPSVEPELYRIEFVPVQDSNSHYVVEIHVSKGTASLYMTGSQNFFIRRDGSNFLMSFDMIRHRLVGPAPDSGMASPAAEVIDMPPPAQVDERSIIESLDLGILLAMVFMSWSDTELSGNERDLLEARARADGLEDEEVELLKQAAMQAPLLDTVASYLPTPESRKAAATIAYLTALSDSILTETEIEAFDKMCEALGLSHDDRGDILMLGEQRIA